MGQLDGKVGIITGAASGIGAACGTAPLDAKAIAAAQVPLGEAGSADDAASGALLLASDASRYSTGSELVIDGGMTAGPITPLQEPWG